ncbi:rust resistance kinase Lr10-like [Cicer arietinum]|uniref:Uncharacterized protein LOC101493523 n=1 Tax=Cicer arietinum TaxID=3827 RepID=A0A3Q7X5U7_CICAR|nr:uncharacterized protein LOC101493523 [Cicer arietinum]
MYRNLWGSVNVYQIIFQVQVNAIINEFDREKGSFIPTIVLDNGWMVLVVWYACSISASTMGREKYLLLQIMVVVLLLLDDETCDAISNNQTYCAPSSCGKITNITHPFRLKSDPTRCGDKRYELSCENNMTMLTLVWGKYYVKEINYKNYTVRLVDPGIQEGNCSSIPHYLLTTSNFTINYYKFSMEVLDNQNGNRDEYDYQLDYLIYLGYVIYLNCSKEVKDDSAYVDTSPCVKWHSKGHLYATFDDQLSIARLKDYCHVKLVTPFSSDYYQRPTLSYAEIHAKLTYGFVLSWMNRACQDSCDINTHACYFNETIGGLECILYGDYCITPLGFGINCEHLSKLRIVIEDIIIGIIKGLLQTIGTTKRSQLYNSTDILSYQVPDSKIGIELGRISGRYFLPLFIVRFTLGSIFCCGLLIYTCRRRHISIYENIEIFLRGSTLMPIRYSYRQIKNMTRSFKDKLGEGGFGSVYKGKLSSGPFVAIKMLGKSKGNGQDFINEVATIGRIHHTNVVRLIGFCVDGSKRALVYEFMPNGSLDKYISSSQDAIFLTYKQMYEISLGVARGITYLHQGCDMQILHFDIKPHNILLDENFIPKVSDFGLAKLYPNDNSIVTLTAARGTIGYMAPELFYKNIGGVSYKADVYSFGMLLMEMASKRRNLNPLADRSSQLFFPFWIYNQLIEEREIQMDEITNEEKSNVKKMFITALWCIQLKPCDRPAMNKVIEMLEGDIENIEMPPKPSLYPNEMIQEDNEVDSNEIELESEVGSVSFIEENTTKPLLMNSS